MIRSNPRILIHAILASALGSAGVFLSCTDSYRSDTSGEAGGGGSGSGAGPGTGGEGGGLITGDGGVCNNTCSNDLKKVVDCVGNVVQQCTPEEGCANAECIPNPCDAAIASKSSSGCEFYAVKTAINATGACFAAFVANTWDRRVKIAVERNGVALNVANFAKIPVVQGATIEYEDYDVANGLDIGQVAILFLSRNNFGGPVAPSCPGGPAVSAETGVMGTGRGDAFRIETDYPVVAYQLVPYGGGMTNVTGASLLLPTSAWDNNYIAINGFTSAEPEVPNGNPSLTIVASQDDTEINLLPGVDIVGGGGVQPAVAGTMATYTLDKGDFLQITQPEELTGSPITSNHPIGVWGAHSCMTVPDNTVADCDSAQQQLAPVRAMGSEFVAAPYVKRGDDDAPFYRMVGAVDGTQLQWSPSTPPGAPTTLNLGQLASFTAGDAFTVRSQDTSHPFYIGQYMTGGSQFAGATSGVGDPEWVTVIPPSQFLDYYAFFTDATYPETSLVVVRTPSKIDGSFADVELDCVGPLEGWMQIGDYEYTQVKLVTGNFQSVGNCSNGRHEMSSTLPFGVTVWGWGQTSLTTLVSYAYPAGAGFLPINEVEIPTDPQ
ncbi:IgGFc-binding protein [Chondromyces apiculatus]|uniref:IgGFc-binding protein N-terminal domain-containing protein n=1 Tax=Chondromyces apiculatus DSM 436 TaxID=1192034 RepID=A0A017SYG4_9BACT|nr:IgGFc-binding protein [Chondromyces apiculatus]EYF02014.1 Hypothetical protein CAP_7493 [Chondromyces apiculatus DSM 436]